MFAAVNPPDFYFNSNGKVQEITGVPVYASSSSGGTLLPSGSSFYMDNSSFGSGAGILVPQSAKVTIYIAQNISATNNYIRIPEGAQVTFYSAAADSKGSSGSYTFSLTGTSPKYTFGNAESAAANESSPPGAFGDITFGSGIYYIRNNSGKTPAIGSSDSGGGTITVNQAATVNASVNAPGGTPTIGTLAENAGCTVTVSGGELNCLGYSGSNLWTYGIDVGSGTVNISYQGKVWSSTSPEDLKLNIAATGGIYGYATASNKPTSTLGIWNAVVGGEVTVPGFKENGVPDQSFLQPLTGDYWNSFTVETDAELTLGAENSSGNLQAATLLVGGANSYVENNGIVIINSITQTVQPAIWNNMPGSVLTIADGATLTVWYKGFVNSAADADSGEPAGMVTIDGKLNFNSTGNFQNDGNATLDGKVTFTNANSSFQNYGTLDIGPIGTVNGGNTPNLVNNKATSTTSGGTVTSQNSYYYETSHR